MAWISTILDKLARPLWLCWRFIKASNPHTLVELKIPCFSHQISMSVFRPLILLRILTKIPLALVIVTTHYLLSLPLLTHVNPSALRMTIDHLVWSEPFRSPRQDEIIQNSWFCEENLSLSDKSSCQYRSWMVSWFGASITPTQIHYSIVFFSAICHDWQTIRISNAYFRPHLDWYLLR